VWRFLKEADSLAELADHVLECNHLPFVEVPFLLSHLELAIQILPFCVSVSNLLLQLFVLALQLFVLLTHVATGICRIELHPFFQPANGGVLADYYLLELADVSDMGRYNLIFTCFQKVVAFLY